MIFSVGKSAFFFTGHNILMVMIDIMANICGLVVTGIQKYDNGLLTH